MFEKEKDDESTLKEIKKSLKSGLKTIRESFKSERVRRSFYLALTTLIMLVLSFLLAFIIFPHESNKIFIEIVFTVIGTVFALLFTFEIFYPRYINAEKYRLSKPDECVAFYEDKLVVDSQDDLMIDLRDIRERAKKVIGECPLQDRKLKKIFPDKIPIVLEYKPKNSLLEIDKDSVVIHLYNRIYTLPKEIELFYEPIRDKLNREFLMEGHFNRLKVRLENYHEENNRLKLKLSRTSYYNTFITNFSADFWPYGSDKVTLREEFHHLLFRNGRLVPLGESPFSDHLGGGGLIITSDGKTLLPKRNLKVAVSVNTLDNSFGGSFDLVDFYDDEVQFPLATESPSYQTIKNQIEKKLVLSGEQLKKAVINQLRDEIKFKKKDKELKIKKLYLLGIVRNLIWLGKPDFLFIALTDSLSEKEIETSIEEFKYLDNPIIDIGTKEIEKISNVKDIFQKEILSTILDKLIYNIYRRCNFRTKPSLGLLTLVYLLNEIEKIEIKKKNRV